MKVTFAYGNERLGIYQDNLLIYEGHSITLINLLILLGIETDSVNVDNEWLENIIEFPLKLSDVRLKEEKYES